MIIIRCSSKADLRHFYYFFNVKHAIIQLSGNFVMLFCMPVKGFSQKSGCNVRGYW